MCDKQDWLYLYRLLRTLHLPLHLIGFAANFVVAKKSLKCFSVKRASFSNQSVNCDAINERPRFEQISRLRSSNAEVEGSRWKGVRFGKKKIFIVWQAMNSKAPRFILQH